MLSRRVTDGSLNGTAFDDELKTLIRDYTIFGKKVVYSYAFNAGEIDSFKNTVLQDSRSLPLIDKYSALQNVSTAVLNQMPSQHSELITVFEDSGLISLIFTGKKTINHRVELAPSDLRSPISNISEIYGVEKITVQGFDCVIIDTINNKIDFCIDNSLKLSAKQHIQQLFQLRRMFCSHFNINQHHFTANIENFFDKIQKYYGATEGVVKYLEFKTNTGSFKSAKMSDINDDLRSEDFHAAGSEAVDQITPFYIEMRFENTNTGNYFNQKIPGLRNTLNSANPIIQYFEILDVVSHEDYLYLKERLYN
jgi:hypothetical protein